MEYSESPRTDTTMAISVSGVYKSYGRGGRKVDVLRDLEMNIPRGHIYGLLGMLGSFLYLQGI